ncbi:hypothetical protein O3M35_001539 [Rhynocoris fuscipes]|uniref:FP protein C-terminal domain-containing protein n=1 Tax=Rhynocoris fuscipes TaxID=488301 RepID=A0AAW1CRY3_9HEMI
MQGSRNQEWSGGANPMAAVSIILERLDQLHKELLSFKAEAMLENQQTIQSIQNLEVSIKSSIKALEDEFTVLKEECVELKKENASLKKEMDLIKLYNLMLKGKDYLKAGVISFIWYRNGILRVRKHQGDPAIIIRCQQDLFMLERNTCEENEIVPTEVDQNISTLTSPLRTKKTKIKRKMNKARRKRSNIPIQQTN